MTHLIMRAAAALDTFGSHSQSSLSFFLFLFRDAFMLLLLLIKVLGGAPICRMTKIWDKNILKQYDIEEPYFN